MLFEALSRNKIQFLRSSMPELVFEPIQLDYNTKENIDTILNHNEIKPLTRIEGNIAQRMDLLVDMINMLHASISKFWELERLPRGYI